MVQCLYVPLKPLSMRRYANCVFCFQRHHWLEGPLQKSHIGVYFVARRCFWLTGADVPSSSLLDFCQSGLHGPCEAHASWIDSWRRQIDTAVSRS